jgi:hypothetical protein
VCSAKFSVAAGPGAGPPGGRPDRFGGPAELVFCMPVQRVDRTARPHSRSRRTWRQTSLSSYRSILHLFLSDLEFLFRDMYLYLVLLLFVGIFRLFLD